MRLQVLYTTAKQKEKTQICQFMRDMKRHGFRLRHYLGRNLYEGPAVSCASISDAMSKTQVPCQYDNLGKDYIVYPRQSL